MIFDNICLQLREGLGFRETANPAPSILLLFISFKIHTLGAIASLEWSGDYYGEEHRSNALSINPRSKEQRRRITDLEEDSAPTPSLTSIQIKSPHPSIRIQSRLPNNQGIQNMPLSLCPSTLLHPLLLNLIY